MKINKVLLVAAVCCSLSSCKKDYDCTCTYTQAGSGSVTQAYELKDVKKKDAQDACNSVGAQWISAGGTCEYR